MPLGVLLSNVLVPWRWRRIRRRLLPMWRDEKKKRSAKKRSSQPTDVLSAALKKKRVSVPDEALDRGRAAQIGRAHV